MKSDRNQAMFAQAGMMPSTMPGMMPGTMSGMMPGMTQGQIGMNTDVEKRIDALERQVRRLDARVTRLETPMMGAQNQGYNTSIPMQDNQMSGFQNPMYMM